MIEREDEARLVERFINGESIPQLAREYGTTEQIVRNTLLEIGDRMFNPPDQHRPDVQVDNEVELIDRFVNGESIRDLALAYHTREDQVNAVLNRASEHMQTSLEFLDETSTDEDIERVNAQIRHMNRYADRLEEEAAQIAARTDYMNRFTDRLNEETDRLNAKAEPPGKIIAFLVFAVLIGFCIFALATN